MGFYLLLPLLAPFLSPRRWIPVLLGGLLISVLYRAWAGAHFGTAGSAQAFLAASQLPGNLAEFLLGASAALVVQNAAVHERPRPAAWVLDLMFLLGLLLPAFWLWNVVLSAGADYWLGHWGMVVAPLVLGLPLSIAVLSLYWGSRIGTLLLANRPIYFPWPDFLQPVPVALRGHATIATNGRGELHGLASLGDLSPCHRQRCHGCKPQLLPGGTTILPAQKLSAGQSSLNASRAAAMVAAMCSSVCADEMKPAS